MDQVERIGVSLEKSLLARFDEQITKKGYKNRSEALRDLIRAELSSEQLKEPDAKAVASVCVVYDHHSTKLVQALTALQHSNLLETICSMHIHLSHHDCMEIIVLKGSVRKIRETADKLVSQKGVKLGQVNFVPAAASESLEQM